MILDKTGNFENPLNSSRSTLLSRRIEITLTNPQAEDGVAIHQLIASCPPLDANSVYCNLLQCSHFADTAIIAKSGDDTVGFVSGYRLPARPDVLFVWQVAVSKSARGQGLASRLLQAQLDTEACQGVRFIETTITKDNDASRALFRAFADKNGGTVEESAFFDRTTHFNDQHDSEYLIRIGPFSQ
jgi:L-2,4-diaminobutyric acid acetyltransferase